ncbi:MAG: PD-(D/E)XK nuclease family protein, partial [Muribaculaceae bacterium]|nr:PD-(D/E)XK nuclease family protein [Muribaculaceae bacterium]
IDTMLKSDIELLAMKILDNEYYHDRYDGHLDRMPGEGKVISLLIAKYVRKMLEIEKKWTEKHPYTFLANEYCEKKVFHWRVTDKYTINFRMSIDRVDRTARGLNPEDEELRFIDFKTGDDNLICMDMKSMLKDHKKTAIFQLLLYC